MKRSEFRSPSSGVTLIEMLVGVAVLGVLMAVAAPSLSALMERRRVVAVAGEVASMFAYARAESNVVADKVNLHMEPDSTGKFSCMRISAVAGTTVDQCRCNLPDDQVCKIGFSKELRNYILPLDTSVRFDATGTWAKGFPYMIAFSRGTHFADVTDARVTVKGIRTGAQLRVEYLNSGRVRTCSPDGSISGFPACR